MPFRLQSMPSSQVGKRTADAKMVKGKTGLIEEMVHSPSRKVTKRLAKHFQLMLRIFKSRIRSPASEGR